MNVRKIVLSFFLFMQLSFLVIAQSSREHLLMDSGWRFALGHAYDAQKDFDHGTAYFSYFAKAGYGDGAASENFDDRAWRKIDLPHDWCVELPFDSLGGHSHGYKAIGAVFLKTAWGGTAKVFSSLNPIWANASLSNSTVYTVIPSFGSMDFTWGMNITGTSVLIMIFPITLTMAATMLLQCV